MTIEIRRPRPEDAEKLAELLAADYGRLGIELTDIDARAERLAAPTNPATERWTRIIEHNGAIEGVSAIGEWKYGDEAPFHKLGIMQTRVLGRLGAYDGLRGIFVLSSDDYGEGGILDAHFDEIVPMLASYRAPMIADDKLGQRLLKRHGFTLRAYGDDEIFGELALWGRR